MRRGLVIAYLSLFVVISLNWRIASGSPVGFDVRQHLSTTTRYGAGKEYAAEKLEEVPPPPSECVPIHLNLVARHGTRAPTKKRIKQMDDLIEKITEQIELDPKENPKLPAWLHDFHSPWEGRKYGGELLPEGEQELYELGQRLRARFPTLFQHDYYPDVYPISATQASRKVCKPTVQGYQDDVYREVAAAVGSRYDLDLTHEDAEGFWLLCKEEAALLNITDRACGLFTASEVELLEWADDIQAHHLKGYGHAINYQMGVPLLEDVVSSMERAIASTEGEKGVLVEAAKLRIAHAETLIPFTCLLGLFLEGGDVKSLQHEKSMKHPLRPPHQRVWKGSLVAPFGANTALVLYRCPREVEMGDISQQNYNSTSEYFVQVLHNEKPTTMPACDGKQLCPFLEFKETVAGPHLKHNFESVCTVEVKHTPVSQSCTRRMFQKVGQIFEWPFQNACVHPAEAKTCKAD